MKTEKEIKDRIKYHNDQLTNLDNIISQESRKVFPNKGLISQLKKQMDEESKTISILSWTLITGEE